MSASRRQQPSTAIINNRLHRRPSVSWLDSSPVPSLRQAHVVSLRHQPQLAQAFVVTGHFHHRLTFSPCPIGPTGLLLTSTRPSGWLCPDNNGPAIAFSLAFAYFTTTAHQHHFLSDKSMGFSWDSQVNNQWVLGPAYHRPRHHFIGP